MSTASFTVKMKIKYNMPKIIKKAKCLPWNEVEAAIRKEIDWLKNTILPSPFEKDFCEDCIYRQIATLILQGKIKVKNIKSNNDSLWIENKIKIIKKHGGEWHSKMMEIVAGHFKAMKCDVVIEPNLNQGRADLGIYKQNERPLFIEIGTVSLPKLLINLKTMKNYDILLVLSSDHIVEFSILEADIKSRYFNVK